MASGMLSTLTGECRSLMGGAPYPVALFVGPLYHLAYANPAFCLLSSDSNLPLGKTIEECLPDCPGCIDLFKRVVDMGGSEQHTEEGYEEAWSYAAWAITPVSQQPAIVLLQITETSQHHRRVTSVNEALLISVVEQHEFVDAAKASAQAMSASVIEKEEQLDRTKEELRSLALRLLQAQEEERRRIARELHDSFSQQLAAVGMRLFQIGEQMSGERERSSLMVVQDQIGTLSQQIRDLSHQLHPSALEHLGLAESLHDLVESFEDQHGMVVRLVAPNDLPRSLPLSVSATLYRIAQESLWNIVKHGGANAFVTLRLALQSDTLSLSITDTGAGFDPEAIRGKGTLGLISIYERAHLAGGQAFIESTPGQGTTVRVTIPLH